MQDYINITWAGLRNLPSDETKKRIEGAATGVILAHTTGRLLPIENGREQQIISEKKFDPDQESENDSPESFRRKNVRDAIFETVFSKNGEDPDFILEIFYVWSTSIEVIREKKREVDTGNYYEVIITQLVSHEENNEEE